MDALRARIEGHLERFTRIALDAGERRRAAVAIVLTPTDEGPAFLLTRRALTLRRNAGNYALPGGMVDPGEDALDAAARETFEELGVTVGRGDVLGLLDDFVTLGGHVVTPVIFWTPQAVTLAPNPAEVHTAWFVPVADLDHPKAPKKVWNPHGPPILRMYVRRGWVNPPTAAWLYQFREVCLHGRECRTDGIGQPIWTAR